MYICLKVKVILITLESEKDKGGSSCSILYKEKIIMDNKVNFSKYQYMENNKITIHNNALKGGSERVLSDIE